MERQSLWAVEQRRFIALSMLTIQICPLLSDHLLILEKFATNGTFNSFNADLHTKSRIDHIFVTSALQVTNYAVLTDGYWTPNTQPEPEIKGNAAPQEISFRKHIHRCPSDHYPIAARIVLKK